MNYLPDWYFTVRVVMSWATSQLVMQLHDSQCDLKASSLKSFFAHVLESLATEVLQRIRLMAIKFEYLIMIRSEIPGVGYYINCKPPATVCRWNGGIVSVFSDTSCPTGSSYRAACGCHVNPRKQRRRVRCQDCCAKIKPTL